MDMYTKKKPLPGQLENCEECGVRFTVTPYSKTGPDGGLLCRTCSKNQEGERKKEEKLKKKGLVREKRRQIQSNLLDGIVQIGTRSLLDQCLKVIVFSRNKVSVSKQLHRSLETISMRLTNLATSHNPYLIGRASSYQRNAFSRPER